MLSKVEHALPHFPGFTPLRAMARPVHYDYDPYFQHVYEATARKVTKALRAKDPALILHCEPAPGLEASAASLIGPDDVVLGCVGRLAVEKNLEAFLSLDLPGTKVVIGRGPALDSASSSTTICLPERSRASRLMRAHSHRLGARWRGRGARSAR